MWGHTSSRHNLGNLEAQAGLENPYGNMNRAVKHYTIAARGGRSESLNIMQQFYMAGKTTQYDYTNALRAYQAYLDEIRSDQRDNADAYSDDYKYY